MRDEAAADEEPFGHRWLGDDPTATVFGTVTAIAGLVSLGAQMAWYAVDEGWIAVGGDLSGLNRPESARATMLFALTVVALGVCLVFASRRGRGTRSNRLVLAALAVFGCLAAVAAVRWYPQNTNAVLVALDPATGEERWRAATGAMNLLGLESESAEHLVVVAHKTRRGCRWTPVEITFDAMTGQQIAIRELPTSYPDIESVPPRPVPPDPTRYVFEQGEPTVICQS